MERKQAKSNGLSVVSLFSGIGGLDLGFIYSGYNVVWANDFCLLYKSFYDCATLRVQI